MQSIVRKLKSTAGLPCIQYVMSIRFQKRIKIAPGVRLNLSEGAPSVSVGPTVAHFNAKNSMQKAKTEK